MAISGPSEVIVAADLLEKKEKKSLMFRTELGSNCVYNKKERREVEWDTHGKRVGSEIHLWTLNVYAY